MIAVTTRPRIEVADILREHGEEFRRRHRLSRRQKTILGRIEDCRTAALGGHKDTCDTCGHVRISYNSCRDRHCPKCQSLKKAEWLHKRKARLLPVHYFHVVFTLPHKLRALALGNKRLMYSMLFRAAAQTLQAIARDEEHLGAQVGFTAILHTWGQDLRFHPHLHCVVTGGGLSEDRTRWVSARANFFLSVKVLGKLFRGKFLAALKAAYSEGKLSFGKSTEAYEDPKVWKRLLDELYRLKWVVYAKRPFGGPENVFRYLGRYTHRVAISNHRIVSLEAGKVSFHYRDYADGQKKKLLTLDALEFLRRFTLHILPPRFVRIRHYGLLAASNIETKLAIARQLLLDSRPQEEDALDSQPQLGLSEPSELSGPWYERLFTLTGEDVFACPVCKRGRMTRTPLERVPTTHSVTSRFVTLDTS